MIVMPALQITGIPPDSLITSIDAHINRGSIKIFEPGYFLRISFAKTAVVK